jgi:hypothetical protein
VDYSGAPNRSHSAQFLTAHPHHIRISLRSLFFQDAAKVYTYRLLKRYNIFQYNDTGMVPNHPNHQLLLDEKLDKKNGYSVSKEDPFSHHHNGSGNRGGHAHGHTNGGHEPYMLNDAHKYVNPSGIGGLHSPTAQGTAVARKPFFGANHPPPLPPPPTANNHQLGPPPTDHNVLKGD